MHFYRVLNKPELSFAHFMSVLKAGNEVGWWQLIHLTVFEKDSPTGHHAEQRFFEAHPPSTGPPSEVVVSP